MQEVLEIAVTGEAHAQYDAYGRRGINVQLLRQAADAEQNILAGILENRTNEFLALSAEPLKAIPH
jgi:hypothetical protein